MTFTKWLQHRLVAHGHSIQPDGVMGPATKSALQEFQKRSLLKMTGVADDVTVQALRLDPKTHAADKVAAPLEAMPPWMEEMYRRKGLHETRDNRTLSDWLRAGRFLGNPAKLPWCGDAVETCIVKTLPGEPVPNNPFWAQAWAAFGVEAGGPKVGAIGVIRWNARSGHVGIVAGRRPGQVLLLGGNQSNAVTLSWFAESRFMAFRWPKTYPVRSYPPLEGSGSYRPQDFAGTR